MPPRRRSTRPRRAKKARKSNKTKNVREFASCSVVRTLDPNAYVGNQMYSFDAFMLRDFDRAVGIAKNYQRFRMTGIKVTWKPVFDTYSPTTPNQKPNLYFMIDKSGSIPDNVTLEGLKQAGARPHALDERPLTCTFKPAVLGESRVNAGLPQAANYLTSPWLSTNSNPTGPGVWNPSDVTHQGLKWYVEQGGVPAQLVYVEVEIQFEFIKPLFPALSATPAKGLMYANLDASPDGIEGGLDGISIPLALVN